MQFAHKTNHNPNRRAKEILTQLGLGDRFNHRPSQLSGGQQQRVAIARALANEPPLLLADEPTGNLDSESSETMLKALEDIRQATGTTVIIVTHDPNLAARADRVLTLEDGLIVDGYTEAANPPLATEAAYN
ncbi:MAG: ATP-binding cassette domain-containing protein [Anaerolineae bacterium]|nr:ATP-binding cassette domain-containing protein [Anaerolineae bacterium]